jgi:hypothetical protein
MSLKQYFGFCLRADCGLSGESSHHPIQHSNPQNWCLEFPTTTLRQVSSYQPGSDLLKWPVSKMIKGLEQRILIEGEFCITSQRWRHLQSRSRPERELLRAAELLPSKGQWESKLRSTWGERISLQRGEALQAHHPASSHREECVYLCVCVCVCTRVCTH